MFPLEQGMFHIFNGTENATYIAWKSSYDMFPPIQGMYCACPGTGHDSKYSPFDMFPPVQCMCFVLSSRGHVAYIP